MSKRKILIWADYACATGFATVSGNIARELEKSGQYDISIVGINYGGDPYDREKWPGELWPAMAGNVAPMSPYADLYGRQRVLDLLGTGVFDLLFIIQDTFIVESIVPKILETQSGLAKLGADKVFKTVYYYPIDAEPMPSWIVDVVAKMDFPVAYTEYAKKRSLAYAPELEDRLKVIYHGTNLEDFHKIEDDKVVADFRDKFFHGKANGRKLIVNVNRNQPRKDTLRNLMVLKKLRDMGHDPMMYLHMQFQDAGGNIVEMGRQLGLEVEKDYLLPSPQVFSAHQGMPVDTVNFIYNCADVVFTPTLGEGWGLSLTEAMATQTPVVAPNHTSITEIGAHDRIALVDAGENKVNILNDMDRVRPVMDADKAAETLAEVLYGKSPVDIKGALRWVEALSWKNIVKQWMQVFDEAMAAQPAALSRADRRRLERK